MEKIEKEFLYTNLKRSSWTKEPYTNDTNSQWLFAEKFNKTAIDKCSHPKDKILDRYAAIG